MSVNAFIVISIPIRERKFGKSNIIGTILAISIDCNTSCWTYNLEVR